MLLTRGLDLEPADGDLGLAPSLPPQVNHAQIENFRFRDWRLDFDIRRTREGRSDVTLKPCFLGSGHAALRMRLPGQSTRLVNSGAEQLFSVFPER
jgi:hypothetical protein